MSCTRPSPDPRLTQALAAAERRLAMLERLAEMGMALAGEISTRAVEFPQRPGVGHEPARAFASVSRAVRLTLVLAARVEKSILAMRKNGVPLAPEMVEAESKDSLEGRREQVRSAVSVAIEREAADAEDAEGLLRRLDERLTERDNFGPLLARPFRACVEAICLDLGLDAEAVLAEETGPVIEGRQALECALALRTPSGNHEVTKYTKAFAPKAHQPDVTALE